MQGEPLSLGSALLGEEGFGLSDPFEAAGEDPGLCVGAPIGKQL